MRGRRGNMTPPALIHHISSPSGKMIYDKSHFVSLRTVSPLEEDGLRETFKRWILINSL